MRSWLEERGENTGEITRAIRELSRTLPVPEHENRELWVTYLPHAFAALDVEHKCTDDEALSELLTTVGRGMKLLGKYEQAMRICRQALGFMHKLLGPKHPKTLNTSNNLAVVLLRNGELKEAEQRFRQTLELRGKILGAEHPDTLASINTMAIVLRRQDKLKEAEQMYRSTIELMKKVLGPEHPGTLASWYNLSILRETQASLKWHSRNINKYSIEGRRSLARNIPTHSPARTA